MKMGINYESKKAFDKDWYMCVFCGAVNFTADYDV